jgi:outer membrane protein assembly factor BamB/tetratricopeptide (TPR) repeat protein
MNEEQPLSDAERDVLTLASIANPLPLDVVKAVIELDDNATSDIVDRLGASGRLDVDRRGLTAADPGAPPARRSMLATRLLDELDKRNAPSVLTAPAAWAAGLSERAFTDYLKAIAESKTDTSMLVDRGIEAGAEFGADPAEIAGLRVLRARSRRNRGESLDAMSDLEAALGHLEGAALVDALAFAGAVEDDMQHPADAERYVAMGMLVAASLGLEDKLGSLATLHGRVLSRVGFSREADDSFDRGLELIGAHGSEVQQFYASLNKAWTAFDRGWMAQAEQGYSAALRDAERIESTVSAADKEIALARAKFGSGDPGGAVAGLERARSVAKTVDAPALEFLATIAEVEGALLYERAADARPAVERLREIVESSFPAWVNRLATLEARVELQAGDRAAARRCVATGLDATPYGANGIRLRSELEAIGLAAAEDWDAKRAAELNDRIIQAGWLGLAAWFMTERAKRDRDPDVGMIAAGMAHRLGNPMLAARAVTVAERWDDPRAGAVAHAVERVARSIPETWRADFTALPFVAPALYRAGQTEHTDDGALIAGLDSALAAAGLSGLDVLSPAQRRAAGLIAAPSKVRSAVRWLAPIIGAAAVAALVAVLLAPEPQEPVVVSQPTPASVPIPTTQPGIGERIIESDDPLFGQSPFSGGESRNSVYDAAIGEPIGIYWSQPVSGFVTEDPVLQGKALYVGTSIGRVYSFDIDNEGSLIFDDDAERIVAPMVVEQVSFDQGGQSRSFVFYGDDDGVLYMRNIDDSRGVAWEADLGSPITGPPLVRTDYVVVATAEGVIYKLAGSNAEALARYPEEGVVEGGLTGSLAAGDGTIYARTDDGRVLLLDEESMTLNCEVAMGAAQAVTDPLLAEGRWFIGTATTAVFSFEDGSCSSGGGIPAYQVDVPIDFSAPVVDGVMWNAADGLLLSINLSDGQLSFTPSNLEATVTSPPVVAGDYVLVGATRSGRHELVWVDRSTGLPVWRFPLDLPLSTRPVVGDGVIIVATDTQLIAIAAPAG